MMNKNFKIVLTVVASISILACSSRKQVTPLGGNQGVQAGGSQGQYPACPVGMGPNGMMIPPPSGMPPVGQPAPVGPSGQGSSAPSNIPSVGQGSVVVSQQPSQTTVTYKVCFDSATASLSISDQSGAKIAGFENVADYQASGGAVAVMTQDPKDHAFRLSIYSMDATSLKAMKPIYASLPDATASFGVSASLAVYVDKDGNGAIMDLTGKILKKLSNSERDVRVLDNYASWQNGRTYSVMTPDGKIESSPEVASGIKRLSASNTMFAVLSNDGMIAFKELNADGRGFSQQGSYLDITVSNAHMLVLKTSKDKVEAKDNSAFGVSLYKSGEEVKKQGRPFKEFNKNVLFADTKGSNSIVRFVSGEVSFINSDRKETNIRECKQDFCTSAMLSQHFVALLTKKSDFVLYRVDGSGLKERVQTISGVSEMVLTDTMIRYMPSDSKTWQGLTAQICENVYQTTYSQPSPAPQSASKTDSGMGIQTSQQPAGVPAAGGATKNITVGATQQQPPVPGLIINPNTNSWCMPQSGGGTYNPVPNGPSYGGNIGCGGSMPCNGGGNIGGGIYAGGGVYAGAGMPCGAGAPCGGNYPPIQYGIPSFPNYPCPPMGYGGNYGGGMMYQPPMINVGGGCGGNICNAPSMPPMPPMPMPGYYGGGCGGMSSGCGGSPYMGGGGGFNFGISLGVPQFQFRMGGC